MRRFLIFLILIVFLVAMTGCDTNTNTMEKHVVQITKENYEKYITIETNVVTSSSSSKSYHYFRGALTYGFYDNVIITYNFTSTDGTTEKFLLLNVGGCGTIVTMSSAYGSSNYEITNVSGSITYWI